MAVVDICVRKFCTNSPSLQLKVDTIETTESDHSLVGESYANINTTLWTMQAVEPQEAKIVEVLWYPQTDHLILCFSLVRQERGQVLIYKTLLLV